MNTTIQQAFYRNGQLREQVPMRNGRRDGVVCTWHKNGVRANEEPYQNGLLHGICRQWNERGELLGKYKMVQGTGVQQTWHHNGQLQLEVSTVAGQFCGRNRLWLRDGTLISERNYLHGQIVSADNYRKAAAKDRTLPKLRGKPANLPLTNLPMQRRIHRVFVSSLLAKQNRAEARSWLQKKCTGETARLLGHFNRESDMGNFVERLYEAGAIKVIVPDIYRDKDGNEFADCLLVRLGKEAAQRKAIRKVCVQLRRRKLGVVQPDEEMGETHLYLSMT
jgi:hypothetical protein